MWTWYTRKKDRQKNEYVAIKDNQQSINDSFQKYRRDAAININFKPSTIIDMLINKGFERIKTNGTLYLRIKKSEFEEMIKGSNDDGIEEVEMEDVDDENWYFIFPLPRRYDAVLLKALFAIGLLGYLGNLFLNTSLR